MKLNKEFKNIEFSHSDVILDTGKETVEVDRKQFIGGSDIPIILGISEFSTPYELALKKAGIEPYINSSNIFTEYGDLYEPYIREYVNKKYNMNFIPACLTVDNFRANTDGYDKEANGILEIKTNNGRDFKQDKYIPQMIFYMICYNKEYGILAEYSREKELNAVMFDRNNGDSLGFAKKLPDNYRANFIPENVRITKIPFDRDYAVKILAKIKEFLIKVEHLKNGTIRNELEFYTFDTQNCRISDDTKKIIDEVEKIRNLKKEIEINKVIKTRVELEILNLEPKTRRKFSDSYMFSVSKDFYNEVYQKYATLDSDKLKRINPDLYEKLVLEYGDIKQVKGSVRTKLNFDTDYILEQDIDNFKDIDIKELNGKIKELDKEIKERISVIEGTNVFEEYKSLDFSDIKFTYVKPAVRYSLNVDNLKEYEEYSNLKILYGKLDINRIKKENKELYKELDKYFLDEKEI